MAMNPAAVRKFLERRLRNSDKMKRLSGRKADRRLAKLSPEPEFALPPYLHQKICFLQCVKHGPYGLLLEMGLGKTAVVLSLFRWRRRAGISKGPMLVLVPGVGNVGQWEDEVRIHADGCKVAALDESMSREDRLSALTFKPDIVVATYQGWLALVCKRAGGKMRIHEPVARELEAPFDTVVFDESHTMMRNHQSLTFKVCRRFLRTAAYRYVLTGTPFSSDPQGLWSQFFVLDGGETLGRTIGLFREAFFTRKRNYWSGWYDYELDPKMERKLYRVIRHRSIRYGEDECLDLPEKVGGIERPMLRPVVMPHDTWAYYERLVEELRAAKGDFKVMDNTYMRLRMLVAGFLPVRDPEGDRHEIVFKRNPKLDALVELLRELGDGKKVVVFHVYKTTGRLISERLKAEKIPHARLYGDTPNKNQVIRRFLKGKRCRVLVASKSGAHGLNLQRACHHMAFYETPDDIATRRQAEKRIRRPGQTRTTYYYDLVVRGSIDERIMQSLQAGRRLFDAIVDGEVSL